MLGRFKKSCDLIKVMVAQYVLTIIGIWSPCIHVLPPIVWSIKHRRQGIFECVYSLISIINIESATIWSGQVKQDRIFLLTAITVEFWVYYGWDFATKSYDVTSARFETTTALIRSFIDAFLPNMTVTGRRSILMDKRKPLSERAAKCCSSILWVVLIKLQELRYWQGHVSRLDNLVGFMYEDTNSYLA